MFKLKLVLQHCALAEDDTGRSGQPQHIKSYCNVSMDYSFKVILLWKIRAYLVLCEKVFLTPITSFGTFGNKNCNQAFVMTARRSFMLLERHHYGNINTSLQKCSNSPSGVFSFNMNGLFNLLIKHQKEETIILCFCFVIQRWTFRSLPCYTTHVCFMARTVPSGFPSTEQTSWFIS